MNATTHRITDGQIDRALRNILAKVNEDCDGDFNGKAVWEVLEHCPATGPELLYAMARASLPILKTKDAERIIKNRAKAIYAYIVLQERVGEVRLDQHRHNAIWMCAEFAFPFREMKR